VLSFAPAGETLYRENYCYIEITKYSPMDWPSSHPALAFTLPLYRASLIPLQLSSHSLLKNVINDSLLYTQVTERRPTNVENYSAPSFLLFAIAFSSSLLKLTSPSPKLSSRTSKGYLSRDRHYQPLLILS
jgi:hypothetical protein